MGKTVRRKGVSTPASVSWKESKSAKHGKADALFHSDKVKVRKEPTRNPNKEPMMDEENWGV
ncbi:hypothetical protein TacPo2_30 [Pantoea bacteriophage TacPo2]